MSDLPEKIGKYPITGLAGKGNMGVVYVGHDPFHDCKVAIKLCRLNPDMDEKAARLARKLFFNEAHMAGVLVHPNIVAILDAGEENDEPYIVMEYVDGGETLATHCQPDSLLPISAVADLVFKCAKALDYAHRRGVIHRDIKPSNVMLTSDGEVKIGDFGVAQISANENTHVMGILGSPQYMSPEQLRDETLTCRTDLYSLGVVMYQLLAGRAPFKADSLPKLVRSVLNDEAPSLKSLRSDLPDEMEEIVRRTLAKNPDDRYQSGSELATALVGAFLSLGETPPGPAAEEKFDITRKLPVFNEFSDEELHQVLGVAQWEMYGPGHSIITEGSDEDSFCILVAGDVVVRKRDHDLATLSDGNCFGEMSYLARTPRSATIVALNDVSLLRISATLMEHSLESCHKRFNRIFLRTLVQRLEKTSDELTSIGSSESARRAAIKHAPGEVLTGIPLFSNS